MSKKAPAEKPPFSEWAHCDCGSKRVPPLGARCGCGHHLVIVPTLPNEIVVHWLGGHWHIRCAFDRAAELLGDVAWKGLL